MDTLFIQFYCKMMRPISPSDPYYTLINGFSDTLDLCKSKGDVLWVSHDLNEGIDHHKTELPLSKGTVHVSASYVSQLSRTFFWAERYPDIEFVVGGPAILTHSFEIIGSTPKNLTMVSTSVEQYFGKEDFSGTWSIDIPKEIDENDVIYLSYTINDSCYWKNCIFCSSGEEFCEIDRRRKNFKFEFESIKRPGDVIVKLGSPAITPAFIRNTLESVPFKNIKEYIMFLRPAKAEMEAIKKLNLKARVRFALGLEYPTERLWNHMGKGFNGNDVLELFKVFREKDLGVTSSVILGWDNLNSNDVSDLENFMRSLPVFPESGSASISIYRLYAYPGTVMHNNGSKAEHRKFVGPLYVGFYPELNKEQRRLNKISEEIIMDYSKEKNIQANNFIVDKMNSWN